MPNRLIPADQVARDFVASINESTRDLSEKHKREFMREMVEWLYRLNGFPPEGPRDN